MPVQAARIAGYPNGSCFAPNARRRARRNDVKAMVAELRKPAIEKLQKEIEANFEWATKQLVEIGNLPIETLNVRASDKIRTIEVLAKLHRWNAPEKTNSSGESKIERIEWVIVEPKNRDGGGVPPPAGEGDRE